MSRPKDFLVEIGTEELPPKALQNLATAFVDNLRNNLALNLLDHEGMKSFATPRRLAVLVRSLETKQRPREIQQKGPPISIAFNNEGEPTKAALSFAEKCGVTLDEIGREQHDGGEWLSFSKTEVGQTAETLIPGIVGKALDSLPIPRRMRWGNCDEEFVRPVQWLILLHGKQVIPATMFDVTSGQKTQGHRFHSTGDIQIVSPKTYEKTLKNKGFIIADFTKRKTQIVNAVNQAAEKVGGRPVGDDTLFEEVTGLTEWPVPVTGSFDQEVLTLPKEVIIATLTNHQRYFPIADPAGKLLPKFITLANLNSTKPDKIQYGNERVIHARLADANFFWKMDQKVPLEERGETLKKIVYQQDLGTVHDQTNRLVTIAGNLAKQQEINPDTITRAALLSKCDLVTGIVGEFPELQGTMGSYYAKISGEATDVTVAIGEQYLPRFSGDTLPQSVSGKILAVADKLNTLTGIFSLGKNPTGNKDPFGLRRAALGIIRVLIEGNLELDIKKAINDSMDQQPYSKIDGTLPTELLFDFIMDRSKTYFRETRPNFRSDIFDAVRACQPTSLLDFQARLMAVENFTTLPEAPRLAAATKRTVNILRKSEYSDYGNEVDKNLFDNQSEIELYENLQAAQKDIEPSIQQRAYSDALVRLASLQVSIDRFFDSVLVMAEDKDIRANRLALISQLSAIFRRVADISILTDIKG